MGQTIKTQQNRQYGLAARQIQGLNIFSANGLKVSPAEDPRLIFLQTLTDRSPSSCLIGGVGLRDLIDQPGDIKRIFPHSNPEASRVGLSEGTFYAAGYDDHSSFLADLTEAFWHTAHNSDDLQYLVECGAVAVFVGLSDDIKGTVRQLISNPPHALFARLHPPQDEWVSLISSYCSLIAIAGPDGSELRLFSQSENLLSLADKPLEASAKAIEAASWYQINATQLKWNEDDELCLMLPSTRLSPAKHTTS